MGVKQEQAQSVTDKLLWVLGVAMIVAGMVANYWFRDVDVALRVAAGIAIVGASCLVMAQTLKGRVFLNFVKEARHELRKVVWPSRQEATKNTILVAIIVVFMSCLLWGVDSLFSWLIAWFVG
jgi:preprotein translocase subunit SecE